MEGGRSRFRGERSHTGGRPPSLFVILAFVHVVENGLLAAMVDNVAEAEHGGLESCLAVPEHFARCQDLPNQLLLNDGVGRERELEGLEVLNLRATSITVASRNGAA